MIELKALRSCPHSHPRLLKIHSKTSYCSRYFCRSFANKNSKSFLKINCSSSSSLSRPLLLPMAVGGYAFSSDDVVVKSPTDRRLYRFIQLANGLCALLVHDPEIYSGEPSGNPKPENMENELEDEDEEEDGEDSDEEEEDEEEEENGEVDGLKGSVEKKAAAALCVGMGSFSDPYEAQGLAHF